MLRRCRHKGHRWPRWRCWRKAMLDDRCSRHYRECYFGCTEEQRERAHQAIVDAVRSGEARYRRVRVSEPGKWTAPDGRVLDLTGRLIDALGVVWVRREGDPEAMMHSLMDGGRLSGCAYEVTTVWDNFGPLIQETADGEP